MKKHSTLFLLLALLALYGCTTGPVKEVSNVKRLRPIDPKLKRAEKECLSSHSDFDGRNLITVAQIKSSDFSYCFSNYLRFEKQKESVSISSCNQISISRKGKVGYVQVTDLYKKHLPNDFKMCLEQEFWKMNFKGLGLSKSYIIRFPLTFKSM